MWSTAQLTAVMIFLGSHLTVVFAGLTSTARYGLLP